MFTPEPPPRRPVAVTAGAVHLPDWLSSARQRELVERCRQWARPPAGMVRHTTRGGVMSVRMVSLGWYWRPYRYSATLPDGTPVKPFPSELGALARAALRDAASLDGSLAEAGDASFDVALVNYYDAEARMGMHQDRDERATAPVVSLSLGDSCVFRFGNTSTRTRPYTDVDLRGGDAFVFGGPARLSYHGVPRTHPGSADPASGMTEGRLNITIRATGFAAPG
ncbi:alpha-ketoglutarate-dependent dioxygenase AlkB [Spiractinospora alimapuensis]|nr:alpha-ketoglutarate-dependent dioxygenase AlkB [Spiractinospora alimapuensis]